MGDSFKVSQTENAMRDVAVATLTFHEAVNYGAVLQCYALQRAIERLGVTTEVLNYSCPAIHDAYHRPPTALRPRVGWLLKSGAQGRRNEAFREFLERNVKTSRLVRRDELGGLCERYSRVVVGSDQVWNTDLTGGDRTYFLDFLPPERRAAYAASIGVRSWDERDEADLAGFLSDFRALTVREDVAADYLAGLLGKRPAVACDPVFLLPREEWEQVAVAPPMRGDYALLFTFGKPPSDALAWARRRARELGCRLAVIHFGSLPIPGAVNVRDAGPAEFLGWIAGARLVVSPSFHVCCFSVIFQRDFCWFRSASDDQALRSRSSRIEDLLKKFSISDREVGSSSSMPPAIDYESAQEILDKYRAESLSALAEVIS